MDTVVRRVVVTEEAGLHARPSAAFAETAAGAEARVTVARADAGAGAEPVPAGSVLSVLGLRVERGDAIVVRASGADAHRVVAALSRIAAP